MASSYETRLGNAPEEGIKAPVAVATVSNITLMGEQTIDGVSVVAGDRVLVRAQTDTTEHGIYDVSVGEWSRSKDWNAANDVISGVLVTDESDGTIYQAFFDGDWEVDVTPVVFSVTEKVTGELIIVDTIADLRNQNPALGTWVKVRSYAEIGDFGGGDMYWDDTSTDDDDGFITFAYALLSTGRWKRNFLGRVASVLWAGAKCDMTTDDHPAIQAVADAGYHPYCPAVGAGYRITETINLPFEEQEIFGDGGHSQVAGRASRIHADFTTGAAIEWNGRSTRISRLWITGSDARYNAEDDSAFGLFQSVDDSGALQNTSRIKLFDLMIEGHGSDGVHFLANHEFSDLYNVTVQDCRRHGFVHDDGTIYGLTTKTGRAFMMRSRQCRAFECGGHALVLGSPGDTSRGYNCNFFHFEALNCAWDVDKLLYTESETVGGTEYTIRPQIYSKIGGLVYEQPDIEDFYFANTTTAQGRTRLANVNPASAGLFLSSRTRIIQPYMSTLTTGIILSTGTAHDVIDPQTFRNAALWGTDMPWVVKIPTAATGCYVEGSTENALNRADALVLNTSTSTRYVLDGVWYRGLQITGVDKVLNTAPESQTITSAVLNSNYQLISLVGEGDTTDTLARLRNSSGTDIVAGDEVILMFGGSTDYNITISHQGVTGSGSFRTSTGANLTLSQSGRSVIRFVANAAGEWVDV